MSYERLTDEEKSIQKRIGLPSMNCCHHHRKQSRRKHPWQHNWHQPHHHHHLIIITIIPKTLPSPTPPIASLTCLFFICAWPADAQEAIPSAFRDKKNCTVVQSSMPQSRDDHPALLCSATPIFQGSTILSSSHLVEGLLFLILSISKDVRTQIHLRL